MMTRRNYPVPDTLGEMIQGASRTGLDTLLVPLGSAPSMIPDLPRSVERFIDLHNDMAGSVPRKTEGRGFRGVPSGRRLADLEWYDPESGAFVGAYHPAGERAPSSLTLAAAVEPGEPLATVVADLGYPMPAGPPAVIIGEPGRPEGLTMVYAPAPSGVAELTFRVTRESRTRYVIVTVEQPPLPRFDELVECYRDAFPGEESLVFDGREEVEAYDVRTITSEAGAPSAFRALS